MKLTREKDFRYLVPKGLRRRYRKESKRFVNYLGFLIWAWRSYGGKESFFLSTAAIVEEFGCSKSTIKEFDGRLVGDGVMEKTSGDWKRKKANEYRFKGVDFWEKSTEGGEKSVPRGNGGGVPSESVPRDGEEESTERNEGDLPEDEADERWDKGNERVESVPREEEGRCTTYKKESIIDSEKFHVSGINYGEIKEESNIRDSSMEESKEANHAKVLVTCGEENAQAPEKPQLFFKFERLEGLNVKLLSKAPYYGRENLSFQELKEGSEWLWRSWRHYKETVPALQRSYEEVMQANRTYYHLITVYYPNREKGMGCIRNMKKEETVFMRKFLLNRWNEFLQQVKEGEYGRGMRIKTKEEFYRRVEEWFSFKDGIDKEESCEAVLYRMGSDYEEAMMERPKEVSISVVDDLIAAEEPLENILQYLKNSNLTSEEIRERWNRFHGVAMEEEGVEIPAVGVFEGEKDADDMTEFNRLIDGWTALRNKVVRENMYFTVEQFQGVLDDGKDLSVEQYAKFSEIVREDARRYNLVR